MNKQELLQWLNVKHEEWNSLTGQFNSNNWEKPGVAGEWSMKDVLAHLTGWNRRLVADMQAVQNNQPKPSPPWPEGLESDDEINAWFYKTSHERSVDELLQADEQVFEQLLNAVKAFPEDVHIETVHHEDREFHLVHLNGLRLHPGEFFDHLRDDHEAKIHSFLEANSQ